MYSIQRWSEVEVGKIRSTSFYETRTMLDFIRLLLLSLCGHIPFTPCTIPVCTMKGNVSWIDFADYYHVLKLDMWNMYVNGVKNHKWHSTSSLIWHVGITGQMGGIYSANNGDRTRRKMALISSFSVHRAGHLIGIVWLNFLSENRNYLVVDALNLGATRQLIGRFLHAFYFDFTCT